MYTYMCIHTCVYIYIYIYVVVLYLLLFYGPGRFHGPGLPRHGHTSVGTQRMGTHISVYIYIYI